MKHGTGNIPDWVSRERQATGGDAMTKDEALKAVEDLVLYLEVSGAAPKQAEKLRRALAALSSPYGEPIAEGRAIHIENPTLGNYWVVYERELAGDDTRHVVLFNALPAEGTGS